MARVKAPKKPSTNAAPPENPRQKTLEHAIQICPTDILVESVLRLVRSNLAVEGALYDELVGISKKKKNAAPMAKWHTCNQCGEQYDATADDQTCHFHEGDLEVDMDCFLDHDERCHGPMDTPENRREWPESFYWNCCEEKTNAEGCCTAEHVPKQVNLKRRRTE